MHPSVENYSFCSRKREKNFRYTHVITLLSFSGGFIVCPASTGPWGIVPRDCISHEAYPAPTRWSWFGIRTFWFRCPRRWFIAWSTMKNVKVTKTWIPKNSDTSTNSVSFLKKNYFFDQKIYQINHLLNESWFFCKDVNFFISMIFTFKLYSNILIFNNLI